MNYFSLALLFLLVGVSGCVTETTGGAQLEADPDAALSRRVELARQYIGRGDWENAKRNLEIAASIDDGNAAVYEAFALVYQSTGEDHLAEKNFERALRIDPKFSRARNNYAAFLFAQGRFEDAEPQFARVTEDSLYSGRPLAFINLGLSRLQLGDSAGAESAFTRALRMDRTNALALLEMGYLKLRSNELATAEQYYALYKNVVRRQSPRGLILGLEIARARGDKDAISSFELTLENLYPNSLDYQRYLRSRDGQGNLR